jgi:hypothetical protein
MRLRACVRERVHPRVRVRAHVFVCACTCVCVFVCMRVRARHLFDPHGVRRHPARRLRPARPPGPTAADDHARERLLHLRRAGPGRAGPGEDAGRSGGGPHV